MFDRILPIIRKEFIQIVREPRTLAMVLLLTPMQVLLLGYAANTDVKHIRTVVADESRDQSSRNLVRSFTTTEYFDVVGYVDGAEQVRDMIDRGDAKAGVVIPPDFARDMATSRTGQVQVLIDGSDPNVASTALFAANALAQAAASQAQRAGLAIPPPAIELRPQVLYNPDMRSVNFMIPGLIGLVLQFQSLILTAFAVVRERERGTLEQLIVSPVKPWELLLGKITPFVLISFWNVGVATTLGLLWFHIEFNGSLLLLLALSVVFLVGSLGLGLLVSTVSHTQTQAIQMSMFILLPAIMLSGMIFPLENMPALLRAISYLLPLTYFLRILRGIALKGLGIEYLWSEVALLAVFGLVVFLISARRFQKTLA
ncbi:MAG: ABC transporter permease [Chloroflexi bacterium]|nr:ABC transporter permease [Chloroflexota bacterium]MCL5108706.1 ABC transporter permease [Chloroflexota bacterium]